MDLEEEFVSKQISLEQQFDVERARFKETLEKTKEQYEKLLDGRDKKLKDKEKEFKLRLEENKDEYEKELAEFEADLDISKEKIDELETLAIETGTAAANIEEEYVDMMDALATDDGTKVEVGDDNPKSIDNGREEEDLDERISVDIDSVPELLEGEKDEIIEKSEESVDAGPENEPFDEQKEELEQDTEEVYDYVSMTKVELVELAKKRKLKFSGNKKKLIERLSNSE